jgi:hypothetical protein
VIQLPQARVSILLGKPKNHFLIKAAGQELLIEKQNKEGKGTQEIPDST